MMDVPLFEIYNDEEDVKLIELIRQRTRKTDH